MNRFLKVVIGVGLILPVLVTVAKSAEPTKLLKTENVIFVMTDGLRWQEVFTGAEEALIDKKRGGVHNVPALKKAFWSENANERREMLLPFLWQVMAKQGQVFGNQSQGSIMHVANGLKFSYPGYSETLCGYPDSRVDRNDLGPNPNVTVFEWLNGKKELKGRVAAFGAWDAFNDIFHRERCGFYVNSAFDPMTNGPDTPEVRLLNRLREDEPRFWEGEAVDAITFYSAVEYFKANKPRLFFVCLGETDEWPHSTRYDQYLLSARRADKFVKMLWELAQEMPEYRGKTTLVFSTDHGRGHKPGEWKGHGKEVDGSEDTWLAVLGPDTPALGERTNVSPITQGQIASTLAAFFGEDYCRAVPKAAKPISEVLPQGK